MLLEQLVTTAQENKKKIDFEHSDFSLKTE